MEDKIKEVELTFTRRILLIEHTCPACATTFTAPKVKRYCSDVCRRKAQWQRNGTRWNANRKKGSTGP